MPESGLRQVRKLTKRGRQTASLFFNYFYPVRPGSEIHFILK